MMNTFLTDLHIHSRYSRATSTRLTVPHLAAWSVLKGISVTATGDFTHPAWQQELREALVEDEDSGLLRLRRPLALEEHAPGYAPPAEITAGAIARRGPLFMLQAEISSIYKKDGAVRKVHNLVFMPDFASVDALCRKLSAIGNLGSDGRPILGLDCRHLLDMVLDTNPNGVVIPAHVWTPWFSLFGSKSGFDTLEACFGDLSPHIFALETGLSSDPDMNRLWSGLDKLAMVSNSDAHSGENLGREATVFSGTPSYAGIFNALRATAHGLPPPEACRYEGTLEFFPEEGKYHLDGHRACNVVLEPAETRRLKGICPVCGKPLTVGVLHRVTVLADREAPVPPTGSGFASLVPLAELLGEILCTGPKSRKVQTRHAELLQRFGPELHILCAESTQTLGRHWPELGEAVQRMRAGQVIRQGGYDGEYGTIRMFTEAERTAFAGARRGVLVEGMLKDDAAAPRVKTRRKAKVAEQAQQDLTAPQEEPDPAAQNETWKIDEPVGTGQTGTHPESNAEPETRSQFTAIQEEALRAGPYPVLVVAGPGAGKTRTLIGRLQRLLAQGADPQKLVAVTFTRKAAQELRERLRASFAQMPDESSDNHPAPELPEADTLHALALRHWPSADAPAILGDDPARALFMKACEGLDGTANLTPALWRKHYDALSLHRERLTAPEALLAAMAEHYTAAKRRRNFADYIDLIENWFQRLQNKEVTSPWVEVLVDEVQDLSPLQTALLQALLPASGHGFFGIGDPDQAIYAFRGAHPDVASEMQGFWPELRVLHLTESHRAGQNILSSAMAVLGNQARCKALQAARPLRSRLTLFSAPDAHKEAARVAEEIATLIGQSSHTLADARAGTNPLAGTCAPSDVAVLVRMKSLMPPLRVALHQRGVPVSVPEAEPFWQEPRVAALLALAGRHYGLPMPLSVPDPSDLPRRAWSDGPETLLAAVVSTPPFDPLLRETPAFRALLRLWKQAGSWPAVLHEIRLAQELDLVREAGETVRIMTLHAAKGLEFRAVFLPCLEEGILPLLPSLLTGNTSEQVTDIDEERRLLYVGLTRAVQYVFASHAQQRTLYGRELHLAPSRFLKALPACFERVRLVQKTKIESKKLSLF